VIATPDELLERACLRAGLSDFGPDGWQPGFEHLIASVPEDVGDDPDAVARVEEVVTTRLINRLRIEEWYATHGEEAAAHELENLLIVIGTGRSGTTATHYLLAADPRFRTLRKWEIEDPVPPPDLATEREDPRRPKSVQAGVKHIVTTEQHTEDRKIHELSFHDDGMTLGLNTHAHYWRDADHTSAFPYHERVLRMLQSHRPPYRWLLKSPDYMYYLPPLAGYYPDAKFVVTHRDPTKVIPSACSVIAEHTRMRLPGFDPDPTEFGREVLEHLLEAAMRGMAARSEIGEERFVDVGQPELRNDPLGVAERIYDFAGIDLTDAVREEMVAWSRSADNAPRGEHRYSAEEFGLTDDDIRKSFSAYLDRYGEYCIPRT
jgi:hypothetical protein